MRRVKLTVAYDGTNYCGWQIQPNGITVEEVLNRELSKLLKEDICIIGASRTDSGVHAMGNVAVFDTNTAIPAEKICYAINCGLPKDIRVRKSEEVPLDFHPRYHCSSKTYEYKILNAKMEVPTQRLYTYYVHRDLDFEAMKEAAKYIVGEHDFKSFCSLRTNAVSTIRTVNSIDLTKDGDIITMRINGNGFLYNMIRIIVGTLMKVGVHFYPPEHVKEILEAKDRTKAGPKVPPEGLILIDIFY